MVNKTYNQCISRILRDVEKQKDVDYEDHASVRRYNAASIRIIENIKYIVNNYPSQIPACIDMMYHSDPDVSLTFACNTVYNIPCSIHQKRKAINRVRELAMDERINGVTRAGLPFAVNKWELEVAKEEAEN